MRRLLLATISIILLISCEKEETTFYNMPYLVIDNTDTSLIVRDLDMTITGSSISYGTGIEIENIGEIGFMSVNDTDPIGIDIKGTNIYFITDSIEIAVLPFKDTAFACYSLDHNLAKYEVLYNTRSDFECTDSVEILGEIIRDSPLALMDGDTLSDNLNWVSYNSQHLYLSFYENTILESNYEVHINHGLWNNRGVRYLCFRYKKNVEYLYFWIKMEVIDNNTIKLYKLIYHN